MSSVNSTARFMLKRDSEKKCKTSTIRKQERTPKQKSCNDAERNEIPEFTQDEAQTAADRLKEVKQVTTMESEPKTSRQATKRRMK